MSILQYYKKKKQKKNNYVHNTLAGKNILPGALMKANDLKSFGNEKCLTHLVTYFNRLAETGTKFRHRKNLSE